jgi:hypothetical protein
VLDRETWLARTLIELANIGMHDSGEAENSERLVLRLAELLSPGEVGLMLADERDQLSVVAASSVRVRDLSLLEERHGGGECAQCQRDGHSVLNRSLRVTSPGPESYPARALAAGFERVSAFPLLHAGDVIGVAAVLHHGRLAEVPARLAEALTEAAAIALFHRRELRRAITSADQLRGALDSRVVIEQAKGATAVRLEVTPSAAFELLRSYARRNNLKLTDVCATAIDGRLAAAALRP